MAPLYPTRKYSILSSLTSTLFILVLIISDTVNSIIYYPIFGCSTTLFLSLIFVRNRHSICKCCRLHKSRKEQDRIDELTYTERDSSRSDKHDHNTSSKSSLCCQCLKRRKSHIDSEKNRDPEDLERNNTTSSKDGDRDRNLADYHGGNTNGLNVNINVNSNIQIEMTPQLSMPQSSEEPDTNEINEIDIVLRSDNGQGIPIGNDQFDQVDIQDSGSDEEILEDGKLDSGIAVGNIYYEALKTASPNDDIALTLPEEAYAMANDHQLSMQTSRSQEYDDEQEQFLDSMPSPSPKPKHAERKLPDGFKFLDENGLNNMGMEDEIMTENEKQQHSRKGSKHHMDPTNNHSIDPTELYNSLFPSWIDQREMTMTGTRTMYNQQENTVIIRSNVGSPRGSAPGSTTVATQHVNMDGPGSKDVDLYGTEDIGPINYNDDQIIALQPVSPKNTPTLHHNVLLPSQQPDMKGLVLLPTNSHHGTNGSFDNQKMSQVIAKLNRVASPSAKNNNTPWGNSNVIRPKGNSIFTPVTSITSAKSQPDDEDDQEPAPGTNVHLPQPGSMPVTTVLATINTMSMDTPNNNNGNLSQQVSPIPVINEESALDWNNLNMSMNMDAFIIEDDGDLFDYSNVKSPQQLMSRYFSSSANTMKEQKSNSKSKSKDSNYKKHHSNGMSTNMMSMTMTMGHENTLSMFSMVSNGSDRTHSRVPSQRPTTEKNIKSFWTTNQGKRDSEHIKNVTLANIASAEELKAQSSVHSHLDFSDLEQHLKLLRILKSQGLMKNPIELLHCHQKLKKRRSQSNMGKNNGIGISKQRSVSKREKFKKYRNKKKNFNNHGAQKSASYKE